MKKLLLLLIIVFTSCGGQSSPKESYYMANEYYFSRHKGKTIKSITYHTGLHSSAGYAIRFLFTDGSHVDVWSYKYIPHIYH